jgi:hypothetical protein
MTCFLKDIQFANDSRNVDESMSEHWAFSTNNIQLQAVNCCRCGNYKCVSQSAPLTNKIKCECSSKSVANGKSGENDDDDMYALPADNDSYSYNKELATKMVLYEQMCAFMDVEKERDLLCEDVVGLILEYL